MSGEYGFFNRFRLLKFLDGGQSAVYLAFDPQRDEEVALKLIRLDKDPEALEAERRGALLQQRLGQEVPEVVKVYECGEHGGFFYIVMEYIEGDDLETILERRPGPLATERAVRITYQLCRVLEIAHDFPTEIDGTQGTSILHGDLKPKNLRLQSGDRLRVLDFGTSKSLSSSHKETRNLFGTFPYTPPEQLRSGGMVNERCDLWAVGIILYRMVAGHEPYPGPRREDFERQITSGPPRPLPGECHPDLKRILQRCLAADPERRYASASELKDDLEAFQAGRPLEDKPDSRFKVTRRVGGKRSASQATRRVRSRVAPQPPSLAEKPAPSEGAKSAVVPPPPPSESSRLDWLRGARLRGRRGLRNLIILALVLLTTGQIYVRSTAQKIIHQVTTGTTPELETAWQRYEHASKFTFFDIGLWGAKEKLHTAALTAADRIFSTYRQDHPTTRQGDWRRALNHLQIAIGLGSDDGVTQAKKLYAQAHIDRIEAASLLSQNKTETADRKWNDALFNFQRAAKLAPEWPDPFLGLARIYAYDRFDLTHLTEALGQARHRGYELKDREMAQLADGHRTEGKRLYSRALALAGEPPEKEILEEAAHHLEIASTRYEEIIGFGHARRNREDALKLIDRIEDRLKELGRR